MFATGDQYVCTLMRSYSFTGTTDSSSKWLDESHSHKMLILCTDNYYLTTLSAEDWTNAASMFLSGLQKEYALAYPGSHESQNSLRTLLDIKDKIRTNKDCVTPVESMLPHTHNTYLLLYSAGFTHQKGSPQIPVWLNGNSFGEFWGKCQPFFLANLVQDLGNLLTKIMAS